MTGKEVAQKVIEHVSKAKDYAGMAIGRYHPDVSGNWKNVPEGHAWISNFDVEKLWDAKDSPNLKPQCKRIIEVLEKWLSGQTNKEMNKVVKRVRRAKIDLNNYYKFGDVVKLHPEEISRDRYDYQLFKVIRVCKTKIGIIPIKNETNVDEALNRIVHYGASVTWYRKYKKEDVTANLPELLSKSRCGFEVSAKELRTYSYRKFYDATSGKIIDEHFENCNEFVLKNSKYWYD